ncbi:MAG: hypothetical protein OEM02_13140 [Desulfobulbaceae bacterium]|nr:hypothetical protein [Desulfobulbaceae bacterium]
MRKILTSPHKICWEIYGRKCHANGKKFNEFGNCIASKESGGHVCWIVAGTLNGREEQDSVAEKQIKCLKCDVYKVYLRAIKGDGSYDKVSYSVEDRIYSDLLVNRLYKGS